MRAIAAVLVLSSTELIMTDPLFNFDWCAITVVIGEFTNNCHVLTSHKIGEKMHSSGRSANPGHEFRGVASSAERSLQTLFNIEPGVPGYQILN